MTDLQRDEPGLREVKRILIDWIAQAAAALNNKKVTDTDIHSARKQLKKARAALRLLRDAIGQIAYRRENAALRDTARPLGAARDSRVLIAALDALVGRHKAASERLKLDKFRRVLRNEQRRARQAVTRTLMAKQRTALRAVIKRSERWRLRGDDWAVLGGGLARTYRNGSQEFARAKDSRDTEHLHDWRKQVKYLWHQLQILQPVRPEKIGELAAQCHKLADYLGDDHDLAVLQYKITTHAQAFDRKQDMDALLHLVNRRRVLLQDKAFALGSRLFAHKPRVFTQLLGKYWKAWRNAVPA